MVFTDKITLYLSGQAAPVFPTVQASNSNGELVFIVNGDVSLEVNLLCGDNRQCDTNNEEDQLGLNSSSIVLADPQPGRYQVSIHNVTGQRDYELTVYYLNGNGQEVLNRSFTDTIKDNETEQFAVTLAAPSEGGEQTVLDYDRKLNPPESLQLNKVNNQIMLTWQDPVGVNNQDVNQYLVYWKPDNVRYYSLLGTTRSLSYSTNQPWSDVDDNQYVVAAQLNQPGLPSTVFSMPTFYVAENEGDVGAL